MTTGTPPPYELADSPLWDPRNCSDWKRSEVIDILNPNATCQISLVHPKINLLQGTGGLVKIQAVKRGPIKFIPLVCGGEKWRCDGDEEFEEWEHNACIVLGKNKSIELEFRPEWGTYKSVVLGNKVSFLFMAHSLQCWVSYFLKTVQKFLKLNILNFLQFSCG